MRSGTRRATKRNTRDNTNARERLLGAAYELFSRRGVSQVGIDAILEKSGCAKASLYNNFDSKSDLAIAFLDRHERDWAQGWIVAEINKRGANAEECLLALFEVFDEWFRKRNFDGCAFVKVLLESEPASPERRAASGHLANIRSAISSLSAEARLNDPDQFAQIWLMLLEGSMVTACEGLKDAGTNAMRAAKILLAGWPRD